MSIYPTLSLPFVDRRAHRLIGQLITSLTPEHHRPQCDMLTDPADSFLAGANMVAMCHEQNFASWCVVRGNLVDC